MCGKCGAALFQGEKPKWCYSKGKTEVGTPETAIYEGDNDDYSDFVNFGNNFGDHKGAIAPTNQPVNPNKQAINNILYSTNPITGNLIEDYKAYRLYSI